MNMACRIRVAVATAVLAQGVAAAVACADTATLAPVRDNTLIEDAAGARSSGAGPGIYIGRNSGASLRRGVVAFDIAAALPPGAVIQSATLRFHVSNVSDTAERTITLHRLLDAWGEGASSATGGSGAPSQPGDATWLHRFYPDSAWSNPGGDFTGNVSASFTVSDVGTYTVSGGSLAGDVQAWLDDPGRAFGWLLRGDESANGSAKRIDSREIGDEALRPLLTIEYMPSDMPVTPATWGSLKHRHAHD